MFMIILKIIFAAAIAFISLCLLYIWLGEREEVRHRRREKLMREKYGFYDENLQPYEHKALYEKMEAHQQARKDIKTEAIQGRYMGEDGSMGFNKYCLYEFKAILRQNDDQNWLWLYTKTGLCCPYSRLNTLLDNWQIEDEEGLKMLEEVEARRLARQ